MKNGKGVVELRRNSSLFAAGNASDMTFEVYRHESVRAALGTLFGRKCVFCESMLLATQSGDIEHFRPKGRVIVHDPITNSRNTKPGYHWLAARWRNLLIACRDCNSPRTQKDAHGASKVYGKASFFPIEDEATRATAAGGERKERALLLHPCIDYPEQHLAFTDEGGIHPKASAGGISIKGNATIIYCGLDRGELLQMRARHRRTVMAAIRHTIAAIEKGEDPGADLEDLLNLLDPKEAYTAYTRHLVRQHLAPYLRALGLEEMV
jgi:uncharacterized protein (TIGR02646 family)